jgi:hypothetical protein
MRAALLATIALTVCAGQETSAEPEQTIRQPQAILDDLRPGHHPVRVYDTPSLRGDYGEFRDGKKLDADCKFIGRLIRSNTRIGETRRSSRQIFKVNVNEYISAIHIRNARDLQTVVPDCQRR